MLLGALRAHRTRRHQTGTQNKNDRETRQEAALRRPLGHQFDALHAQGLALSEAGMLALAFTQLDAVTKDALT